ncbi:unnamed protein product, partial [Pocillopora meandrina]
VNWKKCIICQENKFPKKKFPVSKGTEPGIQRIAHCADIRESGADLKYTNCARIANRLKEKGSNEVLWHRSCYSSFTNEGHIRRIQSNSSSSSTSTKEEQAPADVLEKYKDNGNVFVPQNFCEESTTEYTRYAVDNIDINEETLSGMGTFHATQVAAFRRKEEGEDDGYRSSRIPKLVRRMDAELPKQIHELEEIVVKKKPEPVNQEAKEDWYQSDKNKIKESNKKELSWLLGRLSQQRPELQKIPGWSGFNQLTTDKEQPEVTIVGPLPIVNAPAHEYETLWTVLRRCQAMTALRGGIYTVVTMDGGLYNKAKMLQWEKTEHLKNVVLVLGGFHTQMTFSKVIGQFLESSGISDIWVESEIFGETTAGNILRGKLWNRVIRAHKLTYEALWRVLWPIVVAWARDGGHDDEGELAALPAKLAAGFSLDEKGLTAIDSSVYRHAVNEMGHVLDIIAQFDEAHQHNPTLCYWRQYMLLRKGGKKKGIRKEVESRDQRIGNWDKFITTEENKRSLTNFVSTEISESYERHPRRELVVSGGFKEVRRSWSSVREDLQGLSSSQEEADTRIVLHARDATLSGYKQVNVICRDTDVLVLLLAHKHNLCDEVWMFSGTSRKKRFIPVHRIEIPEETRNSLLAFHAITGCDTTSQFCGIGKGSAWKALDSQTSNLLTSIGETSPPTQRTIADAEAFVCQLYHKGTREVEINRERAAAFRKVKKNIDSLPPTQDALHLHIRRANYQSMIWKRAQEACPSIPRPEDENGWYLNDEGILKPKLMTQEVVSSACIQLAFCGCSSEQSCLNRRCTCVRLSLPCSRACKCCDTNRCRNPENR